jgi:AraC family transcriptional activator of tynA and feaB
MPGDCLAYDVSCPHTIVSPALTRHEVVIVPKELLQERGFRIGEDVGVQALGAHRHRPDRL